MAQKKKQEPKKEQPPAEVRELMARKKLETLCTVRAWEDADFRKALLEDPRGTLEKALQIKFPAATKVTIVEEKANVIRVSLPAKPVGEGELSDDQLEAVAGGGRNAAENWFESVGQEFRQAVEPFGNREYWDGMFSNMFPGW